MRNFWANNKIRRNFTLHYYMHTFVALWISIEYQIFARRSYFACTKNEMKWNTQLKILCSHTAACTTQLNHGNILLKDFFLHCLQFATMCIGYDFKVCLNTKHWDSLFCNFAKLSLQFRYSLSFCISSPFFFSYSLHALTLSFHVQGSYYLVRLFRSPLNPKAKSMCLCVDFIVLYLCANRTIQNLFYVSIYERRR